MVGYDVAARDVTTNDRKNASVIPELIPLPPQRGA